MNISDSFFEDEVREGFYIPAAVKQAWGASLIVLGEIDRVCKKYDIHYIADWGTMLGTLRHGGFVPWDDDLDISMLREDYERFLEVAPAEFPEDFEIYNFRNKYSHTGFLANVVGKSRICFEKEHLEKYHGFPFITGIDISVFDNVCRDEAKEKERVNLCNYIIAMADDIFSGKVSGKEKKDAFEFIEKHTGMKVKISSDREEQRANMYMIVEKLFMKFSDEESDYITRMMPNGLREGNQFLLPRSLMKDYVELPFENISIPVPAAYDYMMRRRFGDYMKLVKSAGDHGYPFFEAQKANLEAVMGFEMPGFKVDKSLIKRNSECNLAENIEGTYKYNVLAYIDMLRNEIGSAVKSVSYESLSSYQEMAIELGTYMEGIKGEGYDLVHILEEFCDEVFALHNMLGNKDGDIDAGLDRLLGMLENLFTKVRKRKEVVFMPFKSDYWYVFEEEYKKALVDEDTDVYVMPIPYYYKNYDGTLRDIQFDMEAYGSELPLVSYEDFELPLRRPDVIYIQSPYDSYNEIMSVNPAFYVTKLRDYTSKLIYIPWFRTEDFERSFERAYHNMKAYCLMPGVLYADEVILHSSVIRDRYIEKLTEYVGEDTREIWENRIVVSDADRTDNTLKDLLCESTGESNVDVKKLIAYYPDFSKFIECDMEFVDKIKRVLDIFEANSERINVCFVESTNIHNYLKRLRPNVYEEYEKLIKRYIDRAWFNICDDKDIDTVVKKCHAYYGDAGVIAHRFRNAGKPVMIENVAI